MRAVILALAIVAFAVLSIYNADWFLPGGLLAVALGRRAQA